MPSAGWPNCKGHKPATSCPRSLDPWSLGSSQELQRVLRVARELVLAATPDRARLRVQSKEFVALVNCFIDGQVVPWRSEFSRFPSHRKDLLLLNQRARQGWVFFVLFELWQAEKQAVTSVVRQVCYNCVVPLSRLKGQVPALCLPNYMQWTRLSRRMSVQMRQHCLSGQS